MHFMFSSGFPVFGFQLFSTIGAPGKLRVLLYLQWVRVRGSVILSGLVKSFRNSSQLSVGEISIVDTCAFRGPVFLGLV